MTQSPPLTPGQVAYHAHARAFLHPDQLQDHLLTEAWTALTGEDRQRWEAVGQDTLGKLLFRPVLEGHDRHAPPEDVTAHLAEAEREWAEIITGPDGQLDRKKVIAELADYSVVLNIAGRVYSHVTGGAVSNPFTKAEVIQDLADGVTSGVASDEVADMLVSLARSLDEKDHAEVLELIYRAATEYGVEDLPQRVEGQNAAAGEFLQACAARRAALTPEQRAVADANEQLLGQIASALSRHPALSFAEVLEKLGIVPQVGHDVVGAPLLTPEQLEGMSTAQLNRIVDRLERKTS